MVDDRAGNGGGGAGGESSGAAGGEWSGGAAGPDGPRLADSASPFLRHGARQPVKWFPWGDEAFEAAKREDKPVLLDIGAVWCHWCHVMDHESYEDEETAALINERFVPVKVDRDERPDVDARYQRAVQAISGQAGWPLTAFLTPAGDPFYGGTYFPPEDMHGRPSFRRVLREVSRVWKEERARVRETAGELRRRLAGFARSEAEAGLATGELVEAAVDALARDFDFRHGGFGHAPKFPNPGGLDLALDRFLDRGEDWARRMVAETLVAMGRGGVFDQLGGGFHRYATDARWLVPHFEKMAHDNGPLLATYSRAYAALGEPSFREVAQRIVAWYRDVAPELVEAGGFPASQDADVGPHDDGSYWTWTTDEVRDALDGDERAVHAALLRFGFDDVAATMPADRSRHVPFIALDAGGVAARLGMDGEEAELLLRDVRARLKRARDRRPRPYVDETFYSGWVALVASGHLAAARHLGTAGAAESALRALDRIWREAFEPDRGVLRRPGETGSPLHLEDQVFAANALLDAFEVTQDPEHLERAGAVIARFERFRDPSGPGLLDRPRDEAATVQALAEPHRPITDSPVPSGNGMAALALLRMAALRHSEAERTRAVQLLNAFAATAARMPGAVATYARAVDWATSPVTTVAIVGGDDDGTEALFRAALATYRPRTVIRRFEHGAVRTREMPPELAAMVTAGAPWAYVCTGRTCAAPAGRPEELVETLRTWRP